MDNDVFSFFHFPPCQAHLLEHLLPPMLSRVRWFDGMWIKRKKQRKTLFARGSRIRQFTINVRKICSKARRAKSSDEPSLHVLFHSWATLLPPAPICVLTLSSTGYRFGCRPLGGPLGGEYTSRWDVKERRLRREIKVPIRPVRRAHTRSKHDANSHDARSSPGMFFFFCVRTLTHTHTLKAASRFWSFWHRSLVFSETILLPPQRWSRQSDQVFSSANIIATDHGGRD